MNVVFTCGGTAGHINPAIAVANIWRERYPNSKILFVCGEEPLEKDLIPKAGFEYVSFPAHGIYRSKTIKSMAHNVQAVWCTMQAIAKCKKLFREFQPQVILGTGGYASFPALMAGAALGIPTCVHESNALPGLTTRLASKKVDKVLVCFPQSARYYKDPSKVEVVGMPLRQELIFTKREDARRELGLGKKPLVVSFFGSQGAKQMNEDVAKLFALEQKAGFPFHHIHAVGSYGWEWMPEYVAKQGVNLEKCPDITMKEYIYNMPTVMAAADLVISRAGSGSCTEISATGTPCILVPSPNVAENHQEKNARALEEKGGAVVVLEKECTPELLMKEMTALLSDRPRYEAMSQALLGMSVPDSAHRLCDIMEKLTRR